MTDMMQHMMQAMAHQQKAQTALYSSKMQQARQQQFLQQQMRMMRHCMNTNHPQIPHEGFGHVPRFFGESGLGVPIGFASLKYENGIPFDEA